MPRDLARPECSVDQLAVVREPPRRQRFLVLLRVPAQHLRRGPVRVRDDDVDVALRRVLDARDGIGGGEAEHAGPLTESSRFPTAETSCRPRPT